MAAGKLLRVGGAAFLSLMGLARLVESAWLFGIIIKVKSFVRAARETLSPTIGIF